MSLLCGSELNGPATNVATCCRVEPLLRPYSATPNILDLDRVLSAVAVSRGGESVVIWLSSHPSDPVPLDDMGRTHITDGGKHSDNVR